MDVNWDTVRPPHVWRELTHSTLYSMCRYWPAINMMEFLPKSATGIYDLYLGVQDFMFNHIADSGPFFEQVFAFYLQPSREGYMRFRVQALSSKSLKFALPNRPPSEKPSAHGFGFGPLGGADEGDDWNG